MMKLFDRKILSALSLVLVINNAWGVSPHGSANGEINNSLESNAASSSESSSSSSASVSSGSELNSSLDSQIDVVVDVDVDKNISVENNNYDYSGSLILNGFQTGGMRRGDVVVLNSQSFNGVNTATVNAGSIDLKMNKGISGDFNSNSVSANAIANNMNVSVNNYNAELSGPGGLKKSMKNPGKAKNKRSVLVLNQQNNNGDNHALLNIEERANKGGSIEAGLGHVSGSFNAASVSATAIANSVNVSVGNTSVSRVACTTCPH